LERVAEVVRQLRWDRLARDAPCFSGEELDDVDRALDLAARFGERLAFFPCQRFGKLLPALLHPALDLVEDLAANRRGRLAPAFERLRSRLAGLGRFLCCR